MTVGHDTSDRHANVSPLLRKTQPSDPTCQHAKRTELSCGLLAQLP